MKKYYLIVAFSLITYILQAQELKIKTNTDRVNISKDPPIPPELSIIESSFLFKDADGNNAIDANEVCSIKLDIENTGKGEGVDLQLKITEKNGIKGLEYTKSKRLGSLLPGRKLAFEIQINSSMSLSEGEAVFVIKIDEANGLGADPVESSPIKTIAFRQPAIKVVQYQIAKATKSGSDILTKKKQFNLEIRIENQGPGKAHNLSVELIKPDNVFCYSGNEKMSFNDNIFGPKEQKIITYTLMVNENYVANTVPLKILINEYYNKYGEIKDITLTINDRINPKPLEPVVYVDYDKSGEINVRKQELLKDIPKGQTDKNKLVVIIANSDYENDLPDIPQAENVLNSLKKYFASIYGLNENDIIVRQNQTNDNLRVFFDKNSSNSIFRLSKEKDLIFYYIGHGGVKDGKSYLCGKDSQGSGFIIDDITSLLDVSDFKSYSLIIDACYSAAKGALGEAIIEIEKPKTKGVYFASSKNNEVSNIYEEEDLTFFSYFFMKTIKELASNPSTNQITFQQIYNAMLDPMKTTTYNKIKKVQEPVITGNTDNFIMRK